MTRPLGPRAGHPPLDPELMRQAVFPPGFTPGFGPQDIARRRERSVAGDRADLQRDGAVTLQELTVPAVDGQPAVPVLVLTPAAGPSGAGIVYIHGGGMIMGTELSIDASIVDAVAGLGIVVVSVGYRLAPEHPYPAGLHDCYAALRWTAVNAGALGIDPARLAIAGTSAGGGLAAGTALLARDSGGPALTHQILYCPMLDDREHFPSSTELDGEASWDRTANRTGWGALLGEAAGGPDVEIYAAPSRATDLRGLPAAFIDVGTVETFRDEDIDYAARLSQAGVPAELHVWPGGFHGFSNVAPNAPLSLACRRARADYLRRELSAAVSAPEHAVPAT